MLPLQVPVIGFVAYSGTGKTTLITQLIPLLKQAGLRIGVIKHSHHNFEIDYPGKDSYRIRAAGADKMLLVSPQRQVMLTESIDIQEPIFTEQISLFEASETDIVLVEGFKQTAFPKIELHRSELNYPLIFPNDQNIIGLASNKTLSLPENITPLNINNPEQIAIFILNTLNAGQLSIIK